MLHVLIIKNVTCVNIRVCAENCLNSSLVKGKNCLNSALGSIVLDVFPTQRDFVVVPPLPTSALKSGQHLVVESYVNSTE
jgi:hypothetical protein